MDRFRTILAVGGLVLIGFVAGFITHRQMVKKEMERVVQLGEAPMFRNHLIRVLHPTDEQKKEMETILDEHVKEMKALMLNNRQERGQLIQELEQDLKPILTEEQLETLQQFNRRFKRPPPGTRPPAEHRRQQGR